MKANNYFQAVLNLTTELNEYEKKQLAIVLLDSMLTEDSANKAHDLAIVQRFKQIRESK